MRLSPRACEFAGRSVHALRVDLGVSAETEIRSSSIDAVFGLFCDSSTLDNSQPGLGRYRTRASMIGIRSAVRGMHCAFSERFRQGMAAAPMNRLTWLAFWVKMTTQPRRNTYGQFLQGTRHKAARTCRFGAGPRRRRGKRRNGFAPWREGAYGYDIDSRIPGLRS